MLALEAGDEHLFGPLCSLQIVLEHSVEERYELLVALGFGILVNAVGPGEISTPMTGAEDEDPRSIEREKVPLGRPGHAREIAAWVAFLASERSSYATGASFVIDGGLTLMAAELSS